jgi:hypothetical protein
MHSISRLVLTASLLLVATEAFAQAKKVELSGMVGYQWGALVDETTKDEGVDSLANALGALGSATYGLIFDYHLTRTMYLELSWDQQRSQLEFIDRAADTSTVLTDLAVNYYQVGLVYNWSDTKKQPFIGVTFGMAQWVTHGDFEDQSGFVFTPIFGYQSWMSGVVGYRAQLKFLVSNMPAGEIFSNSTTGFSHTHTKNTWTTQIHLSVAISLGR